MIGAIVAVGIVLIVVGGTAASIVSYFRLQRHRADAVAMASYRKLAQEAVKNQEAVFARLGDLDDRLTKIEELLRSVE